MLLKKVVSFIALTMAIAASLQAQITNTSTYGIKNADNRDKSCYACRQVLNNMPGDVQFGIEMIEEEIYFVMNDAQWFARLFQASGDGLSVDIISRDLFPCGKKNVQSESVIHRGYLLPPMYQKKMYKNYYTDEYGNVLIWLGSLPEQFKGKDFEINMLLIQDKKVCLYQSFFDIPNQQFRLLEMGAMLDRDADMSSSNLTFTAQKTMKFVVPFEKGKSDYSPEDVKPLYDSLRLTNYKITDIRIKAYASVEGSEETNKVLQEKRAQSMVKALQSFQSEEIQPNIVTAENWVEFLQDIQGTDYASWAKYSKETVKSKLTDTKTLDALEPMLAKHRKAVVELDLELRKNFSVENKQKTIDGFASALAEKDYEQARIIQKAVYLAIKDSTLEREFIKELKLSDDVTSVELLNDRAYFEFDLFREVEEGKALFDRLVKLAPENPIVNYNHAVFRIKIWTVNELDVSPADLEMQITGLRPLGISSETVNRLLVNFYIVQAEKQLRARQYSQKEKSLAALRTVYSKLELDNEDKRSLAGYLAGFAKYDWAIGLIRKDVQKIDVDEDLLFYYINLTMTDNRITRQSEYRKVLLNASNINKERFCKLFDTYGSGGVTFQLLDNAYLKKSYCEFCE